MPDGWEIWYARWDLVANDWTLNPLSEGDKFGDPDLMDILIGKNIIQLTQN